MRSRQALTLLAASAFLCAFTAYGQDAQSLGDVARQSRQQKQQKDAQTKDPSAKDAASKDATGPDSPAKDAPAPKSPHVITNDEIPSHEGLEAAPVHEPKTYGDRETPANSGNRDARAEQWKSQIHTQKIAIDSLRAQIASVSESIRYAGGNCVANCVQWNERQKQKQDQVEAMKTQLEEQNKRLEDMQESARKQGFGSSVYDP